MPQYAGFWLRVIAYLIDGVLVDLATLALAGGISVMGVGAAEGGHEMLLVALGGYGGVLGFLLGLLYWSLLEASPTQATLGKMAVGIQVTDLAGRRVSVVRSLVRNLAKLLSALLLGFGFLMVAFTPRKQGLHDLIAGALVVRKGTQQPPEEGPRLMSGPAPQQATPRTYDDGR